MRIDVHNDCPPPYPHPRLIPKNSPWEVSFLCGTRQVELGQPLSCTFAQLSAGMSGWKNGEVFQTTTFFPPYKKLEGWGLEGWLSG